MMFQTVLDVYNTQVNKTVSTMVNDVLSLNKNVDRINLDSIR